MTKNVDIAMQQSGKEYIRYGVIKRVTIAVTVAMQQYRIMKGGMRAFISLGGSLINC